MNKRDTDQDPLQRTFHSQLNLQDVNSQTVQIGKKENYQPYAVSQEGVIRRFKLYLRSGERISIPYSLLPITILVSNQTLLIKSHELQVTIAGRGLHRIDDAISAETLLYIKQNPSDHDDGQQQVFVKDIQCVGDLIDF